ncbi:type 1 glutamine amidotransferase [Nonomuraea africana]|uniref:GMP synthase-like glutamine amidotransferase n=1 Tax=Nonomuraea africana TaxID=46171 RepID=A0ABR9KGT5_9ACTN|nr:type 1 glutamine amidotransferase [Nonomuraea africana]MBE1560996.1 GMP synthase-like glutamine amidotransferase [Nonomuraea africana]
MRDVLIVQNAASGGPRRMGDWLAADGLELEIVRAFEGAPVPDELGERALVVLGGGYLPSEDDRAPWLAATRALVREALDEGRPYLGVCLGGQMLAEVAGGLVKGDAGEPENGSTPITLRPEAADDALFHGLPEVVTAIEHHKDAIVALPQDAVWLAQTEACPYQAFRVGPAAWGVQFHPEVSPERMLEWDDHGFDLAALHRQALLDEPAATPVWREVVRRFAEVSRNS